jgi:hypothetical protein
MEGTEIPDYSEADRATDWNERNSRKMESIYIWIPFPLNSGQESDKHWGCKGRGFSRFVVREEFYRGLMKRIAI